MMDIIMTTQNAPPKSVFWGKEEDNTQHIDAYAQHQLPRNLKMQKQQIAIDGFVATSKLCCCIVRVHCCFRSKSPLKQYKHNEIKIRRSTNTFGVKGNIGGTRKVKEG